MLPLVQADLCFTHLDGKEFQLFNITCEEVINLTRNFLVMKLVGSNIQSLNMVHSAPVDHVIIPVKITLTLFFHQTLVVCTGVYHKSSVVNMYKFISIHIV